MIINCQFEGLDLPLNATDGYINATALCRKYTEATGKERFPHGWLRLKRSKETVKYVSEVTGIPEKDLVKTIQGGASLDEQGTFLHPDLAIPFASWLSVEFEYKVTKIVQQRIAETSSSEMANQVSELWRVVNTMMVYLQGVQGFNRTLHTGIHNQSAQINPALKQIQSVIDKYQR